MKVLIADKFETTGLDALRALGCKVICDPELGPDTLADAAARETPDVLIVRSTKVPAEVFDAAPGLSLVVRAGAGTDNIDVAGASARGVFVSNCPGKNAIAVAELAWGLILSCDRRIPDQCQELREGRWNKGEYARAAGLHGRTLGVVGVGRIGREVASRGRAFGMRVVAWSRSLTPERAEKLGVEFLEDLHQLAAASDVVSVNLAAAPETRGIIGEEFCNALKPGTILVNNSRGILVDEEALAEVVRTKGVRAGLDVFQLEPGGKSGEFEGAIVKEAGVYGTHHVGASTDQAQQAIAAEVVRVVAHFQGSGEALNCVNRAAVTPATALLTVRHRNRPGVLAHVFEVLGSQGHNVEEMQNLVYTGAEAACARIQLDRPPTAASLTRIRDHELVLGAEVAHIS